MLASLLRSLRTAKSRSRPEANNTAFARELAQLAAGKLQAEEKDNFDHERYSGEDASARAARWCRATLQDLLEHASQYAAAYDRLADSASRAWFTHLVAYRLLGHHHVRLPSNTPSHWEMRALAKTISKKPVGTFFGPRGDYELDFVGERICLDAWWTNIAWTFFFRQYHFERDGVRVAAEHGDRVIDAGACFADTALAFAAAVGPRGHVLSFEIDPLNASVARRNLERNPALAQRIRWHECALAEAEIPLYLHGSGPGAQVGSEPSAHPLKVTTIDRLVEAGELDRLDFIKMDIEGAEPGALAGAERTLRRFRPKLAISIYHRPIHLWSIAQWLESLRLGYRFHLEHYTIHYEETVLYATAPH